MIRSVWSATLLVVVGLAWAVIASAFPSDPGPFGYDEQNQLEIDYDALTCQAFGYDLAGVPTVHREESRVAGPSNLPAKFTGFLAAKGGLMNPNAIRFSQDSIKAGFKDASFGTIDDLAAGLKNGSIRPGSIEPIRLVEREGTLISIDNRRLEAFRRAGVDVPTRMATPAEIQQAILQGKFSAGNLGGTTIRVRGK